MNTYLLPLLSSLISVISNSDIISLTNNSTAWGTSYVSGILTPIYDARYVNITGDSKTLSYSRIIEETGLVVNNDLRKQAILFTIIYLSNNSNNNIKFYNNNLTNVINMKECFASIQSLVDNYFKTYHFLLRN